MTLTPHDVPEAQAIIRRLCALQALVVDHIDPSADHPNDCFCGESGYWPLDSPERFRTSHNAVEFIENAVLTKLGLDKAPDHPPKPRAT